MTLQVESRDGIAHFEGEMTIYSAAAMLREALAAIHSIGTATRGIAFDLAQVAELDTAGVQVLLAARNLATQQGLGFEIVAASAMVREVLGLCGLQDLLSHNDRRVA